MEARADLSAQPSADDRGSLPAQQCGGDIEKSLIDGDLLNAVGDTAQDAEDPA